MRGDRCLAISFGPIFQFYAKEDIFQMIMLAGSYAKRLI